jgi:hypothetical protein
MLRMMTATLKCPDSSTQWKENMPELLIIWSSRSPPPIYAIALAKSLDLLNGYGLFSTERNASVHPLWIDYLGGPKMDKEESRIHKLIPNSKCANHVIVWTKVS